MDKVGGERFSLNETVLKSAADNAKTGIALQEGVLTLEKAGAVETMARSAVNGKNRIPPFVADIAVMADQVAAAGWRPNAMRAPRADVGASGRILVRTLGKRLASERIRFIDFEILE